MTGYALTFGSLLLLGGRAGDLPDGIVHVRAEGLAAGIATLSVCASTVSATTQHGGASVTAVCANDDGLTTDAARIVTALDVGISDGAV